MYRVLLKSMYLVCSGYQVTTHSGAAVNGWEPVYNPRNTEETEREPSLQATYPIGCPSTIDPAHPTLTYTALPAALRLVVSPILPSI
jgi:hypothetical protein